MHRANVIIYILINLSWAISIIAANSVGVFISSNVQFLLGLITTFLIAFFQIFGAYKLWNKSYDIPILATFLFLFQIDITGFKYVPETLANLYVKFEPYKLIIDGHLIDDPTILINLSFSDIQFQSIAINIVILIQLALLIAYDNKITDTETDI